MQKGFSFLFFAAINYSTSNGCVGENATEVTPELIT